MEQRYSTTSQKFATLLGVLVLGLCAACPGYEDRYSGTYVEVRDNALSEEVVVIDFFRFGFYSNAIVRTYRAPQSADPEELLKQPISCAWTETGNAPDDEDGSWQLSLGNDVELDGTFTQGGQLLEVEIDAPDDSGQFVVSRRTLRRFRDSPDNVCNVIRPVPLVASFNLRGDTPNTMPQGVDYTMRQPLFAMLWAGVAEKQLANGTIVYAATNELVSEIYLTENATLDRPRNALTGSLSFSMSPPPERARASSGDTHYALAHFIVIDDACEDDSCIPSPSTSFDWAIEREPIIASSIELGNEPDSPFPQATGLGKALLFVEGSLDELDPNFKNLIVNLDAYTSSNRDQAHFYVVDIFFDEDLKIVGLRLPPDPLSVLSYRSAKLKVSNAFLDNSQIKLPRLSPSAL